MELSGTIWGLVKFVCISWVLYPIERCACVNLKKQGLTEFPSVEDLPSADTILDLRENHLKFIPAGALCHMSALKDLRLNKNELTTIGNLSCVGSSLKDLDLSGNPLIGDNDVLDLSGLPALKNLYIKYAGLTKIPKIDYSAEQYLDNVDLSGNAFIFHGPQDFERFPPTVFVKLNFCSLTTFPNLKHIGHTISKLSVSNNNIPFISEELLGYLPNLEKLFLTESFSLQAVPSMDGIFVNYLYLTSSVITELPDKVLNAKAIYLEYNKIKRIQAKNVVSLKKTRSLYLDNMATLEEVSDYMDMELDNELDVMSCNNLDLCRCEHAWMKVALEMGAVITFTDRVCGDGGEMWSELSSTQILAQCDGSSLKALNASSQWSVRRYKAASCELPAHAHYSDVLQAECARRCLSNHAGCTTYKFLASRARFGQCVVLVPSVAASVVTVPDPDNPDWKCFTVFPA